VNLKFLVFSTSVFVRGERSDSRSGRFTLAKFSGMHWIGADLSLESVYKLWDTEKYIASHKS